MKKTLLSIALLSTISFSSIAEPVDGDHSSASVKWAGASVIIPGDSMTIIGENGSWTPNDGEVKVAADGTFTSVESVILESHEYSDKDGDGVKDIGELYDTNWSLDASKPVLISWGENVISGMDAKVIDLNSGVELTANSGPELTSLVSLAVINESATTTPAINPQEKLEVNATVISSVVKGSPRG
ncbi:hypothetical protein A9D46_07520 [Photobacterium damselae subsp. damselae]|uniref:hypothetical protein n=1 Tax=Photobacterium damselae TaxID=38293 RepID=UPI00084AC7B6|nr:hypothetical protein [Photobacterium damselae]OEC80677.1 hypothetical protein A9D46_07520 [Photobacterium damselae subsp. damselae]